MTVRNVKAPGVNRAPSISALSAQRRPRPEQSDTGLPRHPPRDEWGELQVDSVPTARPGDQASRRPCQPMDIKLSEGNGGMYEVLK